MGGVEFLSLFRGPWDFVIVIAAAVIGSLIVIVVARRTKGKIGFSLFHGFTVENAEEEKEQKEDQKEERRVAINPTWRDVAYILHQGEDIWHKINYIELFETMRLQMNYTEERLLDVVSIMEKNFIDLVKLKLGDENAQILSLPAFHYYQLIITSMNESVLLPRFRSLFRENKLAEKNEIEFNHYLENKSTYLLDSAIHYMDSLWVDDPVIHLTKDDIRDWNDKYLYTDLVASYIEIIKNGRRISVSQKENKQKLLDEFDSFVQTRFPDTNIG